MSQPKRRTYRYSGLSKPERVRLRRQQLIEAGIDLIGTIGLAQTRVRAVCAKAELNERYFYESFDNLEHFAREVVYAAAVRTATQVLTEAAREPAADRAGTGLTALITTFADDPRLGRILFLETMRAGGELAEFRAHMLTGGAGVIRLWLDEPHPIDPAALIETGLAQLRSPETAASTSFGNLDPDVIMLSGATTELIVTWLEGGITITPDVLIDRLTRLYDFASTDRATAVVSGQAQPT